MKSGTAFFLFVSLCIHLFSQHHGMLNYHSRRLRVRWAWSPTTATGRWTLLFSSRTHQAVILEFIASGIRGDTIHSILWPKVLMESKRSSESRGGYGPSFPDCFALPPGMTHAIPISFTLKDWQGVEALSAKGVKLKAVFQQEPFPESHPRKPPDFQIFTNKIESGFVSWDILTRKSRMLIISADGAVRVLHIPEATEFSSMLFWRTPDGLDASALSTPGGAG